MGFLLNFARIAEDEGQRSPDKFQAPMDIGRGQPWDAGVQGGVKGRAHLRMLAPENVLGMRVGIGRDPADEPRDSLATDFS